jgi:hypothetical protein
LYGGNAEIGAERARGTEIMDELVEDIAVHPDHLEVTIAWAPRIYVLLSEVGLKDSENGGVGGAFHPGSTPALLRGEVLLKAA